MLQRIQTLWLFLAAASAFASLKLPYFSGTNPQGIPSSVLEGTETFPIMLVTIGVGVLALITIFLYNNRKLQLRLSILGILLQAILIYLYYRESQSWTGTYALTALLQGLNALFFFLAAKGISHDQKIIRDSNRLR